MAMRPLDLDFQASGVSGPGAALVLAGLVVAASAMLDYRDVAGEVRQLQEALARAQQPPRGSQAARGAGDEAALQQAMQTAMAVARDVRRPWGELFAAVEAAQNDDIAILTFNPDAQRGALRISGEARRREAVLAYMERLGQGGVLNNVVLVEDQVQQQDPERPVRFTLTADWLKPS